MEKFDRSAHLSYTNHALRRMRERNVSKEDVRLVVRIGRRNWHEPSRRMKYTLSGIRVVVDPADNCVVTVITLRKSNKWRPRRRFRRKYRRRRRW